MQYDLVKAGDEHDACYELLEDHHTEQITFFPDDQGCWYARTNTDHGIYSSSRLYRISDDEAFAEELMRILDMARVSGQM